MTRLKTESDFQRFLRKSLSYNYLGICKFKKNHGNEYTEHGVSDIDGHVNGKYVSIECKMWGGRPSPVQLAFTRGVMTTGGLGLFAVYQYIDNNSHHLYWIPGDMIFSYRMQNFWIKTGLISVHEDPTNKHSEMTSVFDCSPITTLLEMR